MFKKYSSIDNHYQTKEIMRWLNAFPELANQYFVLEEKIDGANIQLYFTPGGILKIGKRSQFISPDENFYDVWNIVLNDYSKLVETMSAKAVNDGVSYRLWGEIYGPGIQKRIKYATDKPKLIFFDVEKDDKLIAPSAFHLGADLYDIPKVPIVEMVSGLETALSFNREFLSRLSATDNAEGFVIKPWAKQYFMHCGNRFIFKAKSEAFSEKMKVTPKERKALPERVLEAYNTFSGYVTSNRLDNVIGNHGPFEETKQIGDYIRFMLEDMKKDFVKDGFDESMFEPDELKQIYNVGHKIVPLLKERL